jgi:hypothetical protein
MAQLETSVINDSGGDVTLQLSNAGTHLEIQKLKSGERCPIKSDPNATYREYWVVAVKGTPVVFSSDDCIVHKEIRIKDDGKHEMTPRGDHDQEAAPESFGTKILGLFGVKRGT